MSKIKNLRRRVRPVPLEGGDTLHVRSLSLAELRRVDERAASAPEGDERAVRTLMLITALALCGEDGTPFYPDATDEDMAEVEGLTTDQLQAVDTAAVPSKGDAKN